jgi:hypothetical protein
MEIFFNFRCNVWVNGVQVTDWRTSSGAFTSQNFINKNCTCSIGARAPGNTSPSNNQYNSQGYMTAVYFIDGQALEPTAFGRYNNDEVWVPRAVDFTPAETRYSDFLFTDVTNTGVGATPNLNTTSKSNIDQSAGFATNAFDGNTSTRAYTSGVIGSWFVWRPAESIEDVTGARVFVERNNTGQIWLNGTQVFTGDGSGTAEWIDLSVTGTIDVETIAIQGRPQASAGATLFAIEVTDANGTRILTNPYIWSAGLWANPTTTFTTDTSQLNKTFLSGYPATNAFEPTGNLAAIAAGAAENWITWIGNLTNVNSLVVMTDSAQAIFVNGALATTDIPVGQPTAQYTIIDPPETVTDISVQAMAAANARLQKVVVNGQQLVDGVNSSYGANGFHLDFRRP